MPVAVAQAASTQLRHWIDMPARTPFTSQSAALIIALLAAMHSIVALDLFFNFLPATNEFVAMWGMALWAKILWAVMCLVGAGAAFLLYRRAWLGLIGALVFCACLYVASIELWGGVKGGFWLAVVATALAAMGAARSRSARPAPLGDVPARLAKVPPAFLCFPCLFSSAFTAMICLNCLVYLGAKLILGASWERSDVIVAVFGVAMALLAVHFFQRFRQLRNTPRA
ncbi:hypothetical protein [Arenimonas sp.]|uniref:hypothetical protein n=1 Tax=Arenimonas sp. TaxID=1872635 RepID=UPI0025B97F00|nr:hypothetical protein [Arenimonas sp.]